MQNSELTAGLTENERSVYKTLKVKSELLDTPLTLAFDGQDLTFAENAILFATHIGRLVCKKNLILFCRSAIEPLVYGNCEIHLADGTETSLRGIKIEGKVQLICPPSTTIFAADASFQGDVTIDAGIQLEAPRARFGGKLNNESELQVTIDAQMTESREN